MINGLTPYHARMVAWNVDYNKSGVIDRRELKFKHNSKRLVDTNRNGRVETEELAQSLMRGDVYIRNDRKAYPTYRSYPGYGGGYRPMPGHPYSPPYGHQPPQPQAPGFPYSNRPAAASGGIGKALGGTILGAGVGAGAAHFIQGSVSVATGAAIGGAIGLIGGLLLD